MVRRYNRKKNLKRLIPGLVRLVGKGLPAPERAEAGRTLVEMGDPRFDPAAWYLPKEDLLGFVEVPAGKFIMGSDPVNDELSKDFGEREYPQHELELSKFYISRYPVTVAQFAAFVQDSGHEPEDSDCLRDPLNRPVRMVSWYETIKYCEWLTGTLREWEHTHELLARMLRGVSGGELPGEFGNAEQGLQCWQSTSWMRPRKTEF